MKNWRKLAALILAGILIFAFAACEKNDEDEKDEKKDSAQAEEVKDTEKDEAEDKTAEDEKDDTTVTPPVDGTNTEVNANTTIKIDPETYKQFIGTWYADGSSASYKLNVKDDSTWEMLDSTGEVAASGSLRMNDEDQILELYDPDGSLAISVIMEKEGEINIELMLEQLSDSLSTNRFLNVITNNISDAPPTDVTESEESGNVSGDEEIAPPAMDEEVDAG